MLAQQAISVDTIEATLAGLEADGKTAMLAGIGHELLGIIAVADTVKPEASEAIAMLKSRGIKVVLLSGDNQRTAQASGRQVGIERVIAEVMPEDKVKTIQGLQKDGEVVAMVGDGVNDAPALAAADIGVAIGSGSDVAKETGSIILIRNDVRDVAASIELSRATMRKIKQNLFWAFFYNTIGIPVAAFGLLNPILAAAAMSLSSLSVVANSAMLKRVRLTSKAQEVPA
jgi:Cu+-exporting ATPase